MPPNTQFQHQVPTDIPSDSSKEDLSRRPSSPTGAIRFLRPTNAHFHVGGKRLEWTSRDHRKGRHPVAQGERRPISRILGLEWWNISWWVAIRSEERRVGKE